MWQAIFLFLLIGGCNEAASSADLSVDMAMPSDLSLPADLQPPGPPTLLLTVDELPDYLNGSVPYRIRDGGAMPFKVRVNRAEFTLDAIGGGFVDWATLQVSCDQPLTLPGGMALAAGAPIPASAWEDRGSARRVHFVENAVADGATVACSAMVGGPGGSASSAISFLAGTLPPELDPFKSEDRWLVILSRDMFRIEVSPPAPNGTIVISSVYEPAGNGVVDFDEPMYELGLFSRTNAAAKDRVKKILLDEVKKQTRRIFGLADDGGPGPEGPRIRISFEGDPGAPAASEFAMGTLSLMALGGDGTPEDQANRIVGRAEIDWNNQGKEDDSIYARGVYPTSIIRQALSNPLSVVFLEQMLPHRGGVAFGDDPADAEMLAEGFNPKTGSPNAVIRYDLFSLVIRLLGMGLSSTLCHEMGHSLGLVPDGPLPKGLFSNMPGLSFTESDPVGGHIDLPGLNVMQTGAVTNWADALTDVPIFEPHSLAYLRRRLVIGLP